jgi:hypothetical protein
VIELLGFSVLETWTSPEGDRTQAVRLDSHSFYGGASHAPWLFALVELRQTFAGDGEETATFQIAVDVRFEPEAGKVREFAWTGVREITDRLVVHDDGLDVTIVRHED